MRDTGRRVITQVDIEEAILRDLELLEQATDSYSVLVEEEAVAEKNYKVKKGRLFQGANGSIRDKEAFADVESEEELGVLLMAQAKTKAKREVMRMIHARLENMRTLNANVRNLI